MRKILFISIAVLLCVGCAEQSMNDLQRFVQTAHKDRKPKVEPLPRIRPHETFVYTAANLTDPFSTGNLGRQAPTATEGLAPDPTRRKEPLEQYPLDSLDMVGTLSQHEFSWAVIRAPDGTIHRASPGNYLGQNYGRITAVMDEKVELTELVPGGSGWIERQSNLAIVK